MAKKLFLIDGNSFCYRAFYAIRDLSTSKGQPTNAIYGFITMLNKIINDQKPDYLAVSFDLAAPTFRHEKFKEYKIQRKPMPDELISQMPIIKEVLVAYNIAIFEKEGFEADDVLATIAKKTGGNSVDVFIVTTDKDALQLVDRHIKVYNPYKEGIVYDEKFVKDEFGVKPENIVEIMALAGDSIDNIPGVPGIGPKGAIELIAQFKTVNNLLSNIDKVKGKAKQAVLEKFADQARLSRELTILDTDVPIKFKLEDLKFTKPDNKKLFEMFKELEFRTLLKQIDLPAKTQARISKEKISDVKNLDALLKKIGQQKEFAFRLEFDKKKEEIYKERLIEFCFDENKVYQLELDNSGKDSLDKLRPIFEDTKIFKIGHDIKRDILRLNESGVSLKGAGFDTMVAAYLIDPSSPQYELEDLAFDYLDTKEQTSASLILRLKKILEEELQEKGLKKLFEEIEIPLIAVLAKMELSGVLVDRKFLENMSGQIAGDLERLTKDIYRIAGCEFNINSPKQLSAVLFERLKLPILKRTKTGASTDVGVLEKLAVRHALPATILEYRELAKLKSTYIDAMPKLIDSKTGRLHTSFNQTVTQTGRLSSSQPNLQNIPIKTELGKKIRKAFIPSDKNSVLVSADYSQIELRILAHLSEDPTLTDAFKKDLDIHKTTASLVFNVKEDQVDKKMRSAAKTVNFGIIYGMSPYGLSADLKISAEEARQFIDAYFQRYPKVKDFIDAQVKKARKDGFVTTIFGRRRYIPEIKAENMQIRQFAERTAINMPIQGSAADLIKLAMINIDNEFNSKKLATKMILQVHDELVFDVPNKEVSDVEKLVKDKMENVIKLKIPIKVEINKGRNWFET